MAETIEYQGPLPDGYRLRYIVNENSVRISRDLAGNSLLWLEAGAPLILLISFAIFAVLIWRWTDATRFPPASTIAVRIAGYGGLLVMMVVNGRRAWQNMGIVLEIAVSQDTLYWRKQNIWGDTEYFWPLSSVRTIGVENRLLKVYRFRGPALAAFSFVKSNERAYAAALLNSAIQRANRN